jgi:CubicO group peptidase (beta-lactamase class C family)
MKIQKIILFLFCCFYCVSSLFAQKQINLQDDINDLIYNRLNVDLNRSPCFIIGLIEKDSTFIFPYGTVVKDANILPSPENLFEIGNLTNIFTGRLINILAKESILDKDISINNYLPDSLQNPTATNTTIQQLLTHTSGLPRIPLGIGMTQKNDNQPYISYSKTMLIDYFKNHDFSISEVDKYNYSHLGYALLELIIEYKTAEKFEDVLKKNLLNKQYPNTQINLSDQQKELLVQGFDKSHQSTKPWEYASFSSAVGLKSNLNDLLTLLRENIDTDDYDSMQKALLPSGMKKNVFVGEGWHVIQSKKYYPIIVHTGATSGYRGYMAFVKETRTGVVVLSNSEYALRGLGYLILKELNRDFRKKLKK